MYEIILLISLVILAFVSVQAENLMRTVIYLEVFSLLMALAFLYYNAPDVALAETAIGVGLSTIIYLVAIKKVRVYDLVYIHEGIEHFDDSEIRAIQNSIVRPLEKFIEETVELEPQVTYTDQDIQALLDKDKHDIIIVNKDDLTYLYGYTNDQVFQDIVGNMYDILDSIDDIRVVYRDQEVATNE